MKIPTAKGDVEMLREMSEKFGKIPGVEQVTVNPTTGSIVLQYDADRHDEFHDELRDHCDRHAIEQHRPPATEIDEIAHKIEDQAEFLAEHSASARAVVDFVKRVDREIKVATNNNIDLKIVLAAGIVGFTVLEVERGDAGMGHAQPVRHQSFHRDASRPFESGPRGHAGDRRGALVRKLWEQGFA